MAEGAALMVDHRLPAVPFRQWVLSFDGPMAVRLGYDTDLLRHVCQRFARRVMAALRRHTKRVHGLATVAPLHPGIVIVVQRFRYDPVCSWACPGPAQSLPTSDRPRRDP